LREAEFEAVNRAVDRAWTDRSIYNPLTISAYTGTDRYTETYIREVGRDARAGGYKLNHLYLYDQTVLELLLGDKVQTIVRQLIDGTPLLFNGLNMERGTEQPYHFDTLYMPPRTEGKMVVLWFALEDIPLEAGALQYYPRSHRIRPFLFSNGGISAVIDEMPAFDRYIEAQIAERSLESTRFAAKAGDVFVWHAQLYHGGSPIEDQKLTRRSMVAHYWRCEDLEPEQVWEARPGRFVLDPRWMCEPSKFVSSPEHR
jgi:Phytanoyl-CoA dioxygenase (PhyH)